MKTVIEGPAIALAVVTFIFAIPRPTSASEPAHDLIAKLQGWYPSPRYCTDVDGSQYPQGKPCGLVINKNIDTLEGWLAIKRIDKTHAEFELEAGQFGANNGDCIVYGTAVLHGDALVFEATKESGGLKIEKSNSQIRVSYLPGSNTAAPYSFCHGGANLTTLILRDTDRRPLDECGCEILEE